MQMTGEYRIEAARETVWAALNDPEVLKASIPGCEELEQTADDAFEAKVRAKVGPVSARFAGAVTLSDIVAPESYTISGEGKGGAAGFASGGAKIRLDALDDGATQLHYEVDAKVGGKLAQLGSRLIDSTAKKMADQFFTNFAQQVSTAAPATEAAAIEAPAAEAATTAATEATAPAESVAPAATEPSAAEQAEMQEAALRGAAAGHSRPSDAPAESEADVRRRAAEASSQAVKEARATKSLSPIVWVAGLIAVVAILWALFGG